VGVGWTGREFDTGVYEEDGGVYAGGAGGGCGGAVAAELGIALRTDAYTVDYLGEEGVGTVV
jgi:hypothetical protein